MRVATALRPRRGRALVPAGAALVAVLALGVSACSDDDGGGDDDGAGGSGEGAAASGEGTTSTSLETGGIAVDVPDGWQALPVPQLGFGVGIPGGWEAAVLTDEVLADLATADPAVPGFLDAAHAAARNGSVFYAAGADDQDRVTDLKVRAAPDTGVTDVAGLEAYARQLATDEDLADAEVTVPEDAALPTVEVRYRTTAQRPAGEAGGQQEPVEVTVRGTERLVLSPRGVVYSLIVTSEDAPDHDALAERILDTLTFPPPD